MFERYKKELDELKKDSLFRSIKPIEKSGKYIFSDGNRLLNLSSNDYLGIGSDRGIVQEFLKGFNGTLGSTSARLLTGNSKSYQEFENFLANVFNKDRALLFNSGYHANVGIISSLGSSLGISKSATFSDKLNHASIIDGMRLSKESKGDFYRYKHLDYEHLEELLEKHRNQYETAIIVSESVFSMDGDMADLKKLVELKKKFGCILVVDEAHGFGVFGENGLGIAEKEGVLEDIDLYIGVFGKSVGSMGAFCAGNEVLIDYITNKARSFIFSTALPEVNIEFSRFVIETVFPSMKEKRKHLLDISDRLRSLIKASGLETCGESHIIPVIVGENRATEDLCRKLQAQGYYLLPIRHPTVPVNTARIRISLRADLTIEDIQAFSDTLYQLKI